LIVAHHQRFTLAGPETTRIAISIALTPLISLEPLVFRLDGSVAVSLSGRENVVAHDAPIPSGVVGFIVATSVEGEVARRPNQTPVSLYFDRFALMNITILLVNIATVATDVVEFLLASY